MGRVFSGTYSTLAASTLTMLACVWTSSVTPSALWAQESSRAEGFVRYDGHVVVRAWIETARQLQALQQISPDIWSHEIGVGGFVDARIEPAGMAALQASGIRYEVMIEDVQAAVDQSMRVVIGEAGMEGIAGDPWYNSYKNLNDINARLNELAALRPDLATVVTLGQSLQGRPINAIKITAPGGPRKRGFLVHGCQHAREWITPMAMMLTADNLVRNYGTDARVTALVDDNEFFIVPVFNPDGYQYSWSNDRLWRKNRRNGHGVDNNRNWGYGWGGPGSSDQPQSQTYRGTGPFSEPETAVFRDFLVSNPSVDRYLDIHSYSQLILYPWAWTRSLCPEDAIFAELSDGISAAMGSRYGTYYRPGPVFTNIYPAAGASVDWTYGARGVWGASFELRDRGEYGFLLPPEQIVPASEEAMDGIFAMAEADLPSILFLDVPALFRGQDATLAVGHAEPGELVSFYYTFDNDGGGSTFVPELNVTLDMRDAALIGQAAANSSGEAELRRRIPPGGPPRVIWLQAAAVGRKTLVTLTQIN